MIKLFHGDNIVESRKTLMVLLVSCRGKGTEVVLLDGNKISISDARNALESDSFFGGTKVVVIENLFTSTKSKERTKIIDYIKEGKFDNTLVCWEGKEIKRNEIPPKAIVEIFKVSPIIFRFLESLRPDNTKQMLQLLKELELKEDAEMIFYMISRQFRMLILAKDQTLAGLPEWQQSKLVNQAKHFKADQLVQIYKQLLEIDFLQKISVDAYNLSSRLDLFIATL